MNYNATQKGPFSHVASVNLCSNENIILFKINIKPLASLLYSKHLENTISICWAQQLIEKHEFYYESNGI